MFNNAASQIATDGQNIIAEGSTRKPADPFDIGGGHVDPRRAANPGLIYNMSSDDYIQFLCSLGYSLPAITNLTMRTTSCIKRRHFGMNLNLPSISIPNLKTTVTISRTLTNVGPANSVYKALMQPPNGVKMVVQPQILIFNSTSKILSFMVTFSSIQKLHGDYTFGSLAWSDGEHFVRSPIAVRAKVCGSTPCATLATTKPHSSQISWDRLYSSSYSTPQQPIEVAGKGLPVEFEHGEERLQRLFEKIHPAVDPNGSV